MNQVAKRRAARRAVTVVLLTVGLFALAPASHADPPVAQAWWWAAQNEGLNLPAPLAGAVPEQAGPQGVPEDGLYVAGAAASEEAVAALKFFVPEGARPQVLELVLAGEPTGTPIIRLCAVTSSWTPEQRGAWTNRPEFDCADDAPVGTVSEDSTTVTFDLTGLTLSGSVDFGLAPGLDDTGNVATFQAPLEKPGPDALQLLTADDDSGGFSPPTVAAGPTAADDTDSAPPATTARVPQVAAATGGSNLTPVARRAPESVVASGGGDFVAAPVAAPAPVPMVPASSGNDLRTIGMVGLLALAAFYAWLTGQESKQPTSLLAFGRGSSGPVIDAEALR